MQNMKQYVNLVALTIASLFVVSDGNAQFTQGPQFPSPNAAAFTTYDKYPQSNNTGSPAIQIPLYNISVQGFNLPIDLTYSTNSVKPNTYASWVGLGWNLNAGGSIVRKINEKPDDMNYSIDGVEAITGDAAQGYFYSHNYLADTNWISAARIEAAVTDVNSYSFNRNDYQLYVTIKDYAPDEFSFNVGNISGSFYMDHHGQWKVRSDNKVQVVIGPTDFIDIPVANWKLFPDMPGWPPSPGPGITMPNKKKLVRITLIDNKGIKYIFGGSTNSYEMSYMGVKSWNLSQILLPNGKSIDFTYETGNKVVISKLQGRFGSSYWGSYDQQTDIRYLSSIKTDQLDIQFFRSSNSGELSKLDAIVVNDLESSNQIKKYVFGYQNTPMDRLKLQQITEVDLHGSEISKHMMGYNALSFSGKPSSTKSLYKTDHWEYFSAIPYGTTAAAFYASRDADTTNCRAELLDKIVYPTGGYVQYTWEPHDYSKQVLSNRASLSAYTTNRYAGGVRIKQINSYDKNNVRVGFKRYSYAGNYPSSGGTASLSSGVLSYQPSERFESEYYFWLYDLRESELDQIDGPHISYSEVTEIDADGAYINTVFSNFDNGQSGEYMDQSPAGSASFGWSPVPGFCYNAHERGKPLVQTTFTSSSQIVKQTSIAYERVNKSNDYVRAYKTFKDLDYPKYDIYGNYVPIAQFWYGFAYKIYTNAYLASTVTEKTFIDYDLQKYITTNTSYTYDPTTLNVLNVTTTNSKGETIVIENHYPKNMVALLLDPSGVYSAMVAKNNVSTLIETITSKGATQIAKQGANYIESFTGQFKPSLETVQYGTGPVRNINQFNAYDNAGNLLSMNKEAGPKSSYIYDSNKSNGIAQVTNASHLESYFEGFEDAGAYGYAHTGTRYNEGPYYCGFSLPNGRLYNISYWYRTSPTGLWVFATEPYTGPKTLRSGTSDDVDDVRIIPVDAQMTTYTYDRDQVSSVTDQRNQTIYYEYDNAGRLRYVKDNEGNITKSICYNYAGQATGCALNTTVYISAAQTKRFKKLTCGPGYIVPTLVYSVPAGKYQSTISQEDADRKALSDLRITGQVKANALATCTPGAIYARVEMDNFRTDVYPDFVHADLYLKFYSDINCSIPLAVPYEMDVNVIMHYRQLAGNSEADWPAHYVVDANVSAVPMGQMAVRQLINEQFRFEFSVATDPLQLYTAAPTYGSYYLY
ncbi:DUF5977 domain-containing protein [Mucilaginibacter sp. HD30]